MTFSIIIPSYNQGHLIGETIQSILAQGVSIELIVIDGGSSDQTVEVIKSFGEKINYWVSEPDRGQSHAINKGFKKATGDIIAWLNSDDLYEKKSLEVVSKLFASHSEVDFIHGSSVIFGKGIKSLEQGMLTGHEQEQRLAGMPSPQPSFFFRKSMLDALGGVDETLHYGMDYDFFLRMALIGKGLYVNSPTLSKYRIHEASKTSNDKVKFAEEWSGIYSNLLKSLDVPQEIEVWSKLGVYRPSEKLYPVDSVNPDHVSFSSGLALLNVATFLNLGGDVRKAVEIIKVIKAHYPEVYRFKKVSKYDWKLRMKQHVFW